MTVKDELSRLLAAERAEQPSASAVAVTKQSLQSALAAATPPLPIAHGPLKLGVAAVGKSFVGPLVVAFAATTTGLGLHASLVTHEQGPDAPTAAHAAPPVLSMRPSRLPSPEPSSAPVVPRVEAAQTASAGHLQALPSSSTFSEELRLIKAAKREVDAGQLHLARVWLDEHERSYPRGIFRAERESLRARVAVQKNEPDAPPSK